MSSCPFFLKGEYIFISFYIATPAVGPQILFHVFCSTSMSSDYIKTTLDPIIIKGFTVQHFSDTKGKRGFDISSHFSTMLSAEIELGSRE